MKKLVCLILATVLALSATLSVAFAEGATYEPITIQFWNSFTGPDGAILEQLVNKFNAENQWNITVEMDISSSFTEQLTTALAANSGPALVLFSSAFRFQYADHLAEISDIFEKTTLDKNDFIPSYLNYCSEGDALYLVPFQIVGFYLMWNKDLFAAAGLDPEVPPTNWDEFASFAAAITDESKNVYGTGISYNYAYQVAHVIQRFGGLAVDKDENGKWAANFAGNEGYAEFLQMYRDMVASGSNPVDADTDPVFTAGQIGMTITGPWTTGGLDAAGIPYGIALLPQGAAGEMNSVEVLGFAITNVVSDDEKMAAYRFIEWWNTPDENGVSPALTWSLDNGFPAYSKSVQAAESYKENNKLVVTSSANPDAPSDFIVSSSFAGTNAILNDVILPLMSSITFEDISIEDALNAAQEAADSIVASYN
ncbi:MAG: extracellular solute-binding protein [Bacillota bacterium]